MVTFKIPFGFHAADSSPSKPPTVSSDIGEVLDLLATRENEEIAPESALSCSSEDEDEADGEQQAEFLPEQLSLAHRNAPPVR